MPAAAIPSPARCAGRVRGQRFPRRGNRGSLLIVAMLLSALIGISLVSYIKLSTSSLSLANRSFYQTSAMNLTEMGIEEAIYCYNRLDDVTSPSDAWVVSGTAWKDPKADGRRVTEISGVRVGPGATGTVRVYCSKFNPGNTDKPVIVARATVVFDNGNPPIEKWLQVTLRKRSYWANGMVARKTIDWRGGVVQVDSYVSDHDKNPATPGAAYGSADAPAKGNATVGTPSSTDNALSVSGGEIHGRLLTGGGTVDYTRSTAILTAAAPPAGSGWDTTRISRDFDANFPTVTVPAPPVTERNPVNNTTNKILPGETLPRDHDIRWNNVYYYYFDTGSTLAMSGSETLTIDGPVTFLATAHEGYKVIDLSGNATVTIKPTPTARLHIYTDGNIESTGNGFANSTSSPSALQILGTNATAGEQSIKFSGNGAAMAAIYAPNADIDLSGNAELHGAVVGNQITVAGGSKFHYDESLTTASTGNPYGIEQWRELQSAGERTPYVNDLNFDWPLP